MKKSFLFLFVLFILFQSKALAQANSFYIIDSAFISCYSQFSVFINVGPQAETGGIVMVDWGDGTPIDNYNFSTTTGNTGQVVGVSHNYNTPGSYNAIVNVYSAVTGSNVNAGITHSVSAVSSDFCGYVWSSTNQTSPNYTFSDVPLLFTDVNSTVTTILPYNYNSLYAGLNINNAPYTVQIDPNWLTTHGLIQTTSNFTINSFNANGLADISNMYFNVTCISATDPDFTISSSFTWAVAPTQTGSLNLDICNLACSNTSDVTVTVEMPTNFVPDMTGLTNPVLNGNILTFDMLGLSQCQYFSIPFSLPGTTPVGTQYTCFVTLTNSNDIDMSNNIDTVYGVVSNSYDPNFKHVNQAIQIKPSVQEELTYTIHFQNEGNSDAINIQVKDTISTNLDLSTFKVLGSSHGVSTTYDPLSREVIFSFNNINLPPKSQDEPGSQGSVSYSISEIAGLGEGDEIENTAYIYFDFNPPIITNTAYNINTLTLGLNDVNEQISEVQFYPNPANKSIKFINAAVKAVEIYDMTGKLVLETNVIKNNELSIAHLDQGMYYLVIQTELFKFKQKLTVK